MHGLGLGYASKWENEKQQTAHCSKGYFLSKNGL